MKFNDKEYFPNLRFAGIGTKARLVGDLRGYRGGKLYQTIIQSDKSKKEVVDDTEGVILKDPSENYYRAGKRKYTNLDDAIAAEYFWQKYDAIRTKGVK